MPSIASLVPKLRPMLIGAGLLAVTVFALRDGHHRHDCGRSPVTVAMLEGAPTTLDWSAPSIDPWDVPARPFGTIVPPRHPDGRPWPHGMVIGTPPIDSAIVVWDFSPLDNVLSAFVAGLRALES
jgi:hypothetical protein